MNIDWKTNWQNDLVWCPSQLIRLFQCPIDNTEKRLYCRWRHDDPWTFSIIQEPDWVRLGDGLTQETDIELVHRHAELLLLRYFDKKLDK